MHEISGSAVENKLSSVIVATLMHKPFKISGLWLICHIIQSLQP